MNHLTIEELREVVRLLEFLASPGFLHLGLDVQLSDTNGESLGTITKRGNRYALVFPEADDD